MMSDEELVKTVAYLKGVVRTKYRQSMHVSDLVDEVTLAVMLTLPSVDFSNPSYRSYICRGVLMHIRNYWAKNYWSIYTKMPKAATTVDHMRRNGTSRLDDIVDDTPSEIEQIMRIRLREELDKLPQREREILEMWIIDRASIRDIALKYHITSQRVSQITIATRTLLSKRLNAYRRAGALAGECRECGNPCRDGLPYCDTCRDIKHSETVKRSGLRTKERKAVAA